MERQVLRDIDYAATAVKTAITEKYGRKASLDDLQVTANERTISVRDGARAAEGTRDQLLSTLRKSNDYEELWCLLATLQTSVAS